MRQSIPARASRTHGHWIEFAVIFIAVPALLTIHPTRLAGHVCLWLFSLYALYALRRTRGFSFRTLWNGKGWSRQNRYHAIARFIVSTAAVTLFTQWLTPYRLFVFPMAKPGFWLLVMILYPLLSALPQELVFRSYFFRRFGDIFPNEKWMFAVNVACFAFIHAMFHNWVSPLLSAVGGGIFAWSYRQHRSLKWAAIEHAAYGCMIFTVGIGFYFLVGGASR